MARFEEEVRTRFAPSPSGYLHVGGARTALFNYLYAKAKKGKFVVRVEDTDQERSTPESERLILDSLKWLGIHADEGVDEGGPHGPYRQSDRLDRYQGYTNKLLEKKAAFKCFCTPDELEAKKQQAKAMGLPNVYDGKCRNLTEEEIAAKEAAGEKYAIRFKVDPREIVVQDIVQERVKFDAKLIGDFIIVKSDGFPSYNYAVVIDDYEMRINYVIRGVGHLSNTPRQIMIHEALDMELPEYAHISEIVGMDKKKLSKRKGSTSVLFFKELGYISEAFVNYMALLGWYPEDAEEFMPDGALDAKFDIVRCSKSPAMFDFLETVKLAKQYGDEFNVEDIDREELKGYINQKSKLNWMNNKYMRHMALDGAFALAVPFLEQHESLAAMLKSDRERVERTFDNLRVYLNTLEDAAPFMLEIFKDQPELSEGARGELKNEGADGVIEAFKELLLSNKPESPDDFKDVMKQAGKQAGAKGRGLFMPIRAATTGVTQGLELPTLFSLLGYETVHGRIESIVSRV